MRAVHSLYIICDFYVCVRIVRSSFASPPDDLLHLCPCVIVSVIVSVCARVCVYTCKYIQLRVLRTFQILSSSAAPFIPRSCLTLPDSSALTSVVPLPSSAHAITILLVPLITIAVFTIRFSTLTAVVVVEAALQHTRLASIVVVVLLLLIVVIAVVIDDDITPLLPSFPTGVCAPRALRTTPPPVEWSFTLRIALIFRPSLILTPIVYTHTHTHTHTSKMILVPHLSHTFLSLPLSLHHVHTKTHTHTHTHAHAHALSLLRYVSSTSTSLLSLCIHNAFVHTVQVNVTPPFSYPSSAAKREIAPLSLAGF